MASKVLTFGGMPRIARQYAGSDSDPGLPHVFNRLHADMAGFTATERDAFLGEVRRYAFVFGVQVVAFAVLPRQFHLLLKLPAAPPQQVTDEEFWRRFDRLVAGSSSEVIQRRAAQAASEEGGTRWQEFRRRTLPGAHLLQEFVKRCKQRFTAWCRTHRGLSSGTELWAGRYEVARIEEHPGALLTVAAAFEGTPLRLGLCRRVGGWRWTTLGAVEHGSCEAAAVWAALFAGWPAPCALVPEAQTLFFKSLLQGSSAPPPNVTSLSPLSLKRGRGPATPDLPWHLAVRERVRELSEGLAVGSWEFVADYLKKYPAVRVGRSIVVPKRLVGGDFRGLFAVRKFTQIPGRVAKVAAPYSAGE